MAKYTINDFQIGDEVYHLSNTNQMMVAIKILKNENEISCKWVDKNGNTQDKEFMPEELGKKDDLRNKATTITLQP